MVLNSTIVKLYYPPDCQLHLRRMNNLILVLTLFLMNMNNNPLTIKISKISITNPNDHGDVATDGFEAMENDSFKTGRAVGAADQAEVRQVRKKLTDHPLETFRKLK